MPTVISKTSSDRLAEMAGDRVWPLANRYGVHSPEVQRALRAWGRIWHRVHEQEVPGQGSEEA